MQQHARELSRAILCLSHPSFGVVLVFHHNNPRNRAKVEIRKLVAGRQSRNK